MRKKPLALATGLLLTLLQGTSPLADENANSLHIYNWADYIGEKTISDFETRTGIKVVYDTYDSYETVEGKLLAGKSGYDLVVMEASLVPRLLQAGIFQPLDKARLPSWGNLNPTVLKNLGEYDPGVRYSAPYTWGTTGITYNADLVREQMPDAPIGSMALLFDPSTLSHFKDCGVTVLDSPTDVIPMALAYLGLDPNSSDKADIEAAETLLQQVRPLYKKFDSTAYLNDLPNRESCISMTWSGDYATASMRAQEAGIDIDLQYFVPKEGAPMWFDSFYIPSDAPHVENAHRFIEYMLQPEVIAEVSNFIAYANANDKAAPFMAPEVANNPAIYPDDLTMAKLFSKTPKDGKASRLVTRSWRRIKTGH